MPALATPFANAAAYYDQFRAPYAPAAIDFVAQTFGISRGVEVLDLGCGPGSLAIQWARRGAKVTAVDIDKAMLGEARRLAGDLPITFVEGRAEDVIPALGSFRMVSFGNALHWMDRDGVLAALAPKVMGLAIFDEGARRPQESWERTAAEIVRRYLGDRPRHPGKHPEARHQPCLDRSAHFADYQIKEFPTRVTRDAASVLGCVYSGIGVSKKLLGKDTDAFEADLKAAILGIYPSGVFTELIETAVFTAWTSG